VLAAVVACDRSDTDGDRVPDRLDNCFEQPNPEQVDSDRDGYGNACDPDYNDDGWVNFIDLSLLMEHFDTAEGDTDYSAETDHTGDGAVDAADRDVWLAHFGGAPGPSGLACAGNAVCTPDTDGDGVEDHEDDCTEAVNPRQIDTDRDGYGNACDLDPGGGGRAPWWGGGVLRRHPGRAPGPSGLACAGSADCLAPHADADGDGVANAADNCALTANASQHDVDVDGFGDACAASPARRSGLACAGSYPCGDLGSDSLRRVLLLGLDGADWDVMDPLIDAGYLPNLGTLVAGGARAALDCVPASPVNACFCPPVWASVATGQPRRVHGMSTIGDLSSTRQVKALWNVVADHGGSSVLIGYRGTHPPEADATIVLSEPAVDYAAFELFDRYPPPDPLLAGLFLAPDALTRPPRLFETLGLLPPPDAPLRAYNMPARDRASQESMLRLARRLTRQADLTVVLLHSIDKAEHLLWGGIQDRTGHPVDTAQIRADAAGYVGPIYGWAGWGTLTSQYREADQWLGRLLAHARFDAIVVASDHGMSRNRGECPSPLEGHHCVHLPESHDGILVLHGPGVAPGVELANATVLDVAPTVAYLMGLPVADDLPGRVLSDAFTPEQLAVDPVRTTATWE
jgi:hypothetical protein